MKIIIEHPTAYTRHQSLAKESIRPYTNRCKEVHSMSDPRERVKKKRQQEILEAFQESAEPVLTTGEVSEHIDSVSQETVRKDLQSMNGDRISGKKTSKDYVWWVPTENKNSGEEKVATQDQLRRAVVELAINRTDYRILTPSLIILAALSVVGVTIFFMLLFNTWLLPISQRYAVLLNYSLMVAVGLAILSSGLIVIGRDWNKYK